MKDTIALSNQSDIIKERNEQIYGHLGFFLGQIGNKEFLIIFFDPKWSTRSRGGSKDNVSEREDFSLSLLDCAGAEGKVLTLRQDFSKEHWLLIIIWESFLDPIKALFYFNYFYLLHNDL